MNHKKKILLVGTVFLAIALLLGVYAFLTLTSSFSVGSYHTGSTGEKGSTASYTFRSTTTSQQPGDKQMSTSSYTLNLGWLSLGSLKIVSTSIIPLAVINGSNVALLVSASNTDTIWVSITKPDSGIENITLTNNVNTNFTNTTLIGRYNITFYANDSSGEVINNTPDFFESFVPITFNFSIVNFNVTGVNSSWELIFRDTIIASSDETDGNHSKSIPDATVDLRFKSFTEKLQITLEDINVSLENGKNFGMDKHTQISDFLVTYGINNSYNFTNATVRIFYDDLSFSDENNLQLHKCDNYNFSGRSCLDPFSDITSSATQNTENNYFETNVTSFSGFGIKEVIPSTSSGEETSEEVGGGLACRKGYKLVNQTCVEIEEIPSQLFDISFSLDDSLIQNINELSGIVTFESFGTVPTPVDLVFIILDSSGNEIYREVSEVIVTTEEILRWNYEGLEGLPDGKYTAILETLYNVDVSDEFRQEFEIGAERRGITGRAIDWVGGEGKWWLSGVLGLFAVGGLVWWLIRKFRKKPREGSISFEGKVSNILRGAKVK